MEIYQACRVYLVFGIYAINSDSKITLKVWDILSEFKNKEEHCLGCHGVVVDEEGKKIYCDVVLDFDCDRKNIRDRVIASLKADFPEYQSIVTIDSQFV